MELRDYVNVLRQRWGWVLVGILVGVLGAASVIVTTPRQYTSTTQLFFATTSAQSNSDISQGSTFAQQQMKSYAQVATSPSVLQPVIDRLGLGTTPAKLADRVTATVATSTVVLELSVQESSPALAQQVATEVAKQLTVVVEGLSPARADGTQSIKITVVSPAALPVAPSSPKTMQNLALGLLAGLVVGIAAAFLRENFDTRIRSPQDLEGLELPIVGMLPNSSDKVRQEMVRKGDFSSPWAEAVRRLRTNLQFVSAASGGSVFLITSSIPQEGKTTTGIALASALASTGTRVLLVDADLRRPRVAEELGIESTVGLTSVLIGRADLADVVQPWQDSTLDVLPCGHRAPNPSELLGSQRMGDLVAEMAAAYDVVIVDGPPTLPVTDAAVLSKWTNGVIIVARADLARKPQVGATLQAFEQVGATVLGFVVNGLEGRRSGGYGYGYGYSYKATSDEAPVVASHAPAPAPARAAIGRFNGGHKTKALPEPIATGEGRLPEGNQQY